MRFARSRTAFLLVPLFLAACAPYPASPDMSTRESFARSVMTAAASGSVEAVEKMAGDWQVDVRPEAQRLVDFAKDWDAATGEIKLSNDFPEVANVDATKKGTAATIRYRIAWSHERWDLSLGVPRNPPSGGAKPAP